MMVFLFLGITLATAMVANLNQLQPDLPLPSLTVGEPAAGKGFIWVCLPFVAKIGNAREWWGAVEATVQYCRLSIARVCEKYGGDTAAVFITDAWVLRDLPERRQLRDWVRDVLMAKNGGQ